MKSRKTAIIIIIILLVGLFALNRRKVTLVKQDEYTVNTISPSGMELKYNIWLNNPNLLSSTIKTIREEIYLNNTLIAVLDQELNQGIPGMKESRFPITVRFDKKVYENLNLQNTSKSLFQIKGAIVYQNLLGGDTIKVNESYKP